MGSAVRSQPDKAIIQEARITRGNKRAILALCLVLLTITVYNPVVHNGFVSFDDPSYVTTNKHIQNGLSWPTIAWAFRSMDASNWHPLTWLSHALDWQLFGSHAAGHHYVSVLLHALCAVLLFLFLQGSTGSLWRSLCVSALFAVHPINVESVAWIAERKNVLSTVFFLLALIAYSHYIRHPEFKKYVLVVFCFALGLMSKPMVVTLPFVLLLMDYWPLQSAKETHSNETNATPSGIRFLMVEKIPLFALSVASAILTVLAQRGVAIKTQYSFSEKLGNAAISYCRYLGKFFWPSGLTVLYPHPLNPLAPSQVVASMIFLFVITAIVFTLRKYRYLAVGWLWFMGTLVPVIGLIQVGEQAMADRYAYIPFIGLFIALVWGVGEAIKTKPLAPVYSATAAIIVITALSVRTHSQIHYWHDSTTLWSHALDVTENNFVALDSLGAELLDQGKIEEAASDFKKATQINPNDGFSWLDLGVCEKQMGNTQAAIQNFQLALNLPGDQYLHSTALNNLGSIYRRNGNYQLAQNNYQAALRLFPENVLALTGMALIAQKTNDLTDALNYYAKAATIAPSDVSYLLLAQALEKSGNASDSRIALQKAQQISRNWQMTQIAVQRLLAE